LKADAVETGSGTSVGLYALSAEKTLPCIIAGRTLRKFDSKPADAGRVKLEFSPVGCFQGSTEGLTRFKMSPKSIYPYIGRG
jgi:hypothetical protein